MKRKVITSSIVGMLAVIPITSSAVSETGYRPPLWGTNHVVVCNSSQKACGGVIPRLRIGYNSDKVGSGNVATAFDNSEYLKKLKEGMLGRVGSPSENQQILAELLVDYKDLVVAVADVESGFRPLVTHGKLTPKTTINNPSNAVFHTGFMYGLFQIMMGHFSYTPSMTGINVATFLKGDTEGLQAQVDAFLGHTWSKTQTNRGKVFLRTIYNMPKGDQRKSRFADFLAGSQLGWGTKVDGMGSTHSSYARKLMSKATGNYDEFTDPMDLGDVQRVYAQNCPQKTQE